MKWLLKLSKEELLDLHKTVVYLDILDDFEFKDNGLIIFFEHWESGYIPTSYEYTDFGILGSYEVYMNDTTDLNIKFVKWMSSKFGKDYIIDLLYNKTSVEPEYWESVLK